jgi:hypothetical protein
MGVAVLLRPMPGVRPGGRPSFLGGQERRQRNRPCRKALRVRSDAQVCRAAPNSLRYAAFKQGARIQSLKSLRDARQTFRSSPMQKGNPGIPHASLRIGLRKLSCARRRLPTSEVVEFGSSCTGFTENLSAVLLDRRTNQSEDESSTWSASSIRTCR